MGEEELLWNAVDEALKPILLVEYNLESLKLEKRLRDYFRKPVKTLNFDKTPWLELLNTYADAVFSGIFGGLGDKEWLQQIDFLLCLDSAVKDNFPKHVLQHVPQMEFEKAVLAAHDRAYEEQRIFPILWKIVQQMVDGPKAKKKVYNSIEEGWKVAFLGEVAYYQNPAQNFVGTWIDSTINLLSGVSQQEPQWVLDPELAAQVFNRALAEGAMPYTITSLHGSPPQGWRFVTHCLYEAYEAHSVAPEAPAPKKKAGKSAGKGKRPLPAFLEGLPDDTCRDFILGHCTRGGGCKFIHDDDVKAEVDLKRSLEEFEEDPEAKRLRTEEAYA